MLDEDDEFLVLVQICSGAKAERSTKRRAACFREVDRLVRDAEPGVRVRCVKGGVVDAARRVLEAVAIVAGHEPSVEDDALASAALGTVYALTRPWARFERKHDVRRATEAAAGLGSVLIAVAQREIALWHSGKRFEEPSHALFCCGILEALARPAGDTANIIPFDGGAALLALLATLRALVMKKKKSTDDSATGSSSCWPSTWGDRALFFDGLDALDSAWAEGGGLLRVPRALSDRCAWFFALAQRIRVGVELFSRSKGFVEMGALDAARDVHEAIGTADRALLSTHDDDSERLAAVHGGLFEATMVLVRFRFRFRFRAHLDAASVGGKKKPTTTTTTRKLMSGDGPGRVPTAVHASVRLAACELLVRLGPLADRSAAAGGVLAPAAYALIDLSHGAQERSVAWRLLDASTRGFRVTPKKEAGHHHDVSVAGVVGRCASSSCGAATVAYLLALGDRDPGVLAAAAARAIAPHNTTGKKAPPMDLIVSVLRVLGVVFEAEEGKNSRNRKKKKRVLPMDPQVVARLAAAAVTLTQATVAQDAPRDAACVVAAAARTVDLLAARSTRTEARHLAMAASLMRHGYAVQHAALGDLRGAGDHVAFVLAARRVAELVTSTGAATLRRLGCCSLVVQILRETTTTTTTLGDGASWWRHAGPTHAACELLEALCQDPVARARLVALRALDLVGAICRDHEGSHGVTRARLKTTVALLLGADQQEETTEKGAPPVVVPVDDNDFFFEAYQHVFVDEAADLRTTPTARAAVAYTTEVSAALETVAFLAAKAAYAATSRSSTQGGARREVHEERVELATVALARVCALASVQCEAATALFFEPLVVFSRDDGDEERLRLEDRHAARTTAHVAAVRLLRRRLRDHQVGPLMGAHLTRVALVHWHDARGAVTACLGALTTHAAVLFGFFLSSAADKNRNSSSSSSSSSSEKNKPKSTAACWAALGEGVAASIVYLRRATEERNVSVQRAALRLLAEALEAAGSTFPAVNPASARDALAACVAAIEAGPAAAPGDALRGLEVLLGDDFTSEMQRLDASTFQGPAHHRSDATLVTEMLLKVARNALNKPPPKEPAPSSKVRPSKQGVPPFGHAVEESRRPPFGEKDGAVLLREKKNKTMTKVLRPLPSVSFDDDDNGAEDDSFDDADADADRAETPTLLRKLSSLPAMPLHERPNGLGDNHDRPQRRRRQQQQQQQQQQHRRGKALPQLAGARRGGGAPRKRPTKALKKAAARNLLRTSSLTTLRTSPLTTLDDSSSSSSPSSARAPRSRRGTPLRDDEAAPLPARKTPPRAFFTVDGAASEFQAKSASGLLLCNGGSDVSTLEPPRTVDWVPPDPYPPALRPGVTDQLIDRRKKQRAIDLLMQTTRR